MKRIYIVCLMTAGIWTGCTESYQKKFLRIAEQENASCPRRIDSHTVMDSTRYDAQSNTVHYFYSLSGTMDNEALIKENTALYKSELQRAVLNLPEMQEYVKHQTTFHIVYHSSSTGKVLMNFKL